MSEYAEGDFFIMMNSQIGDSITAIINHDGSIAQFETESAARNCAKNHDYCKAFGYEIFERGTGL